MMVGDRVALSATFLRSICPDAARGWPTPFDLGKGWISRIIECGGITLADVLFEESGETRRFNTENLVHEKDIYSEAMHAEHKPRYIG